MDDIEIKKSSPKRSKLKEWLSNIEFKVSLKTSLAASLSFVLGLAFAKGFNRPDSIISGLWSVMAAIVVMQAYLGGTYRAAWVRFLGVIVGSIAGAVFLIYVGHDALSLGLSIFSTMILCSMLGLKESFRIASLSTAVIVVSAGYKPDISPWLFSLYRFADSCIGIASAIIVAQFIWPEKAVENLRLNIAKVLGLISKYYRLSVDLENHSRQETPSADALYEEIEDLLEDNYKYSEEAKLELQNKEVNGMDMHLIANQLDEIFSTISSLRSVNKESLAKIFDDSLAKAIHNVIEKTDQSFQRLEKKVSLESYDSNDLGLEQALDELNRELLRFRETRTTRKFNLQDVESFYVFFHGLRAVGESVEKIENKSKI